jgi:hypothetical protein
VHVGSWSPLIGVAPLVVIAKPIAVELCGTATALPLTLIAMLELPSVSRIDLALCSGTGWPAPKVWPAISTLSSWSTRQT